MDEDLKVIEDIRLMQVKARVYAAADIDNRMREKSGGLLRVDSLDPMTIAAVRLGVDAGIKAALQVMVERTEEFMTPEERTEADADADRILGKMRNE